MKRIIEIKNITLGDADPYNFHNYPSPGIYKTDKDMYYTFFVGNGMVLTIPDNQIISEPFIEPEIQSFEGAITLDTMLKTVQKPELAFKGDK